LGSARHSLEEGEGSEETVMLDMELRWLGLEMSKGEGGGLERDMCRWLGLLGAVKRARPTEGGSTKEPREPVLPRVGEPSSPNGEDSLSLSPLTHTHSLSLSLSLFSSFLPPLFGDEVIVAVLEPKKTKCKRSSIQNWLGERRFEPPKNNKIFNKKQNKWY